ncbi:MULTISPECIES: nuclear transport factor 2 family protein [unclassified Rathayibacter]|uniref:nuclear transport factor 2 family protein n=1 Tax=unclassified Rathayibacter TaxID=2609250 RepID=UPI000CE80212|nr:MULTISPECIES: nuclear transport factor 2 family protein [unclassified Rathayibacter]PPF13230.1 hypothetical protein C5B98_02245 [Rathayibacter sp. AY1A5]PPF40599.1 hypothetical protein C5B93_03160 [Rathayibacter sp. AY1A2]PPF45702.1 hypothetical protein C5E14_12170 [Rathayibacter sp. AY1A1]PPF72823.1 hypothetical protein C5C46_06100 [Rathayibacter sp. AY1E6]PPG86409.1 hypothetical protein C5C29_03465 [Rathayibacter sp. AY1H2]
MIDIESWITGYEKAWATDDAADVAALFTEDAEYFTAPHRDAITPRDAIVEWWLAEEEPADPTFAWGLVALTEETAVVEGRTVYPGDRTYLNLWVIRFAPDGRARSFTEWYMEEPADSVS